MLESWSGLSLGLERLSHGLIVETPGLGLGLEALDLGLGLEEGSLDNKPAVRSS